MTRRRGARPLVQYAILAADVAGVLIVAALIYVVITGAALARCTDALEWEAAETREGIRNTEAPGDLLVVAPAPHGYRWCYWNSPSSGGDVGTLTVAGVEIGFAVTIQQGPEILHFTLPGAIATDEAGVPLREIAVPDNAEARGLLFGGMM